MAFKGVDMMRADEKAAAAAKAAAEEQSRKEHVMKLAAEKACAMKEFKDKRSKALQAGRLRWRDSEKQAKAELPKATTYEIRVRA